MKARAVRVGKYIAVWISVLILCVSAAASSFLGAGAVAFAATSGVNFDETDVLDDLSGSTIGGKKFDVKDYGFSRLRATTVLYLAEYCYSQYVDLQDHYGLYLYLWNPQNRDFVADSSRNSVQLACGAENESESKKYPLRLLSVSSDPGSERLFYKYKIEMTVSERKELLRALNKDERVYHVVEVELLERGENSPGAIPIDRVYKYSGFSVGYGPDEEKDTLVYTATFGDVLNIDRQGGLHQTFFRPQLDESVDGETQETLQSVYFSVPNKYFKDDYKLDSVRMTWLKAQTAPGLITGNQIVYEALKPWIGVGVRGEYVNGDKLTSFQNARGGTLPTEYAFSSLIASFNLGDHAAAGTPLSYLAFLFPTPDWSTDSADSYVLSWEDILNYMTRYHDLYDSEDKTYFDPNYKWATVVGQAQKTGCDLLYTRPYGGELLTVDGITYDYSRALFSAVAPNHAVMDISAGRKYSLTSKKIDSNWWTRMWHYDNVTYTTRYNGISAIHTVSHSDFGSTETETCNNLFIDTGDYSEFRSFYDRATAKDETVVLVRYDVGQYLSAEGKEGFPASGLSTGIENGDTNARVFSMSVYLGLDVIQLEFDNGVKRFYLPCVSSPIDAGSDSTQAAGTHSDKKNYPLQWILLLVGLVVVILLIWKVFEAVILRRGK